MTLYGYRSRSRVIVDELSVENTLRYLEDSLTVITRDLLGRQCTETVKEEALLRAVELLNNNGIECTRNDFFLTSYNDGTLLVIPNRKIQKRLGWI